MLRLSDSQQDIVKLLRRHGSQTVEDLHRALGVTAVAVRHHLDVPILITRAGRPAKR